MMLYVLAKELWMKMERSEI